jgi:hypothetical protein
MKLIQIEKKCINNCKNDIKYKFEYKGECYEKCPSKTKISKDDPNLCEEIKQEEKICNLKTNDLNLNNNEFSEENLTNLTTDYANNYGYFDNYVYKSENDYYKIYIYNNIECLQNTSQDAKLVDFGKFYESFLMQNNFIKEPIVVMVTNKTSKETKYAFADPEQGNLLDICGFFDDSIILVREDIQSLIDDLDDKKEEYIMHMTKQGINVFDINHEFYTNLCFHYNSPNNKDIPMNDRIPTFFVNITPCDTGCINKGVDFELEKFKCECKFKSFADNNALNSNLYGQSIAEMINIISSLNIEVLKCIKDIFNKKYFVKCIGGHIILGLFGVELVALMIYSIKGLSIINKHTYALVESFKNYEKIKNEKSGIIEINEPSFPPKKKERRDKKVKTNVKNKNESIINDAEDEKNQRKKKKKSNINFKCNKTKEKKFNVKNNLYNIESNTEKKLKINTKKDLKENKLKTEKIEIEDEYMKIIKDYINPDFDENDFDDVLKKDKRTFCQYFCEKFMINQIFINTFFIKEHFKPRILKIMLLIMTIELYFAITGLFYTEDYLSDRFNSNQKETFFSFIPKRINEFIYTSIVNGIIAYLFGYFFDNEEFLMQLINFIFTFIAVFFRYLAIKCNNQKLFTLSLNLE